MVQRRESTAQLPAWIRPGTVAAVWLGMIAYGTLVPFQFHVPDPLDGIGGLLSWLAACLTSPAWVASGIDDVSSLGTANWVNDLVLNLLLYLPLGVLLRLHTIEKKRSLTLQIMFPLLVILTLTWGLECLQGTMLRRFASLNDIVANTGGGVLGILIAVRALNTIRQVAIWKYRRSAYALHLFFDFLANQRRRPITMFLVIACNIATLACWYASAGAAGSGDESTIVNWLPFSHHLERSYDVAALCIGKSLVIYGLFSMILSIQFLRIKHRRGLGWVVLGVAVLAIVREVIELGTAGTRPDITEPIIGVMAVGFVTTTAFLLFHAVRCSCRRSVQMPIAVDRRRVPFNYEA